MASNSNYAKKHIADISRRGMDTENPYIEDVVEKYCGIEGITLLALGSSYWTPPKSAMVKLAEDLMSSNNFDRYGSIFGSVELIDEITHHLRDRGIHMGNGSDDIHDQCITVSAGANQAFASIAMAVCDNNDNAVLLAPFYFSHKCALQLAGANLSVCDFDHATLGPDWDRITTMMNDQKPKMVNSTATISIKKLVEIIEFVVVSIGSNYNSE